MGVAKKYVNLTVFLSNYLSFLISFFCCFMIFFCLSFSVKSGILGKKGNLGISIFFYLSSVLSDATFQT